jgi:hypothetical protein
MHIIGGCLIGFGLCGLVNGGPDSIINIMLILCGIAMILISFYRIK